MGMPIRNVEVPSVFETHGKDVEDYLEEEWGRWNDPRGIPETCIFKHQISAARNTKKFLEDPNKPNPALVLAPTGSGKTGIICLLPYLMRSKSTLILTPSPLISEQIKEAVACPVSKNTFFEKTRFFKPSDDPSADRANKDKFLPNTLLITSTDDIQRITKMDLVIVNAQKLGGNSRYDAGQDFDPDDPVSFGRITDFFKSFDLLIVDEAHHFPAKTWYNIKRRYDNDNPSGNMVFVTASVMRLVDGKEKRILPENHEAYVVTNEQLEEDVKRPLRYIDFLHSEEITRHLVSELQNKLKEHDLYESRFKHQALVLVPNKAYAEHLAVIFNDGNPNKPARAIVGGKKVMSNVIEDFKQGKFRIAVVCKMLTEGFDNPSISICVIFRKVQSRLLFEQFIGRCMRRKRFESRNEPLDRTPAVVLTYRKFEQSKHFDALNIIAETFSLDDEYDGEDIL